MSRIAYDPVKDRFANIIRNKRFLRTLFYKLLDLFFLRSWYVRHLLKKHATSFDESPWKLLDAGCGFGQYDRFILQRFGEVSVQSVDVKEDYLDDCKRYFTEAIEDKRIQFQKADLLSLQLPQKFDFAICIDVLEHIAEDERVIKNIYAHLKPGGYFLMHSPSIYSEEDAGEDDSFVDEHARVGYARQDIRQKLQRAGFAPIEIAYTYGKKGHLAWELLIKHPMLWMNKLKLWALPLMAIYYLFTLPVGLALMKLDMRDTNEKGTGIYALAQK